MSIAHRIAGYKGGRTTVAKYGIEHMREIGRLGGRPTWQEELTIDEYRKQALLRVRSKR
jgi:hypothetical protein